MISQFAAKRVLAAIAAVTLTAGLSASGGDLQDHPDASSIKEAAAKWADAFDRDAVDEIVAMYSDDPKLLPEAGDAISGRPGVREFFRKSATEHPGRSIRFSNFEFFGAAPNVTEVSDFEIRDGKTVVQRGKQVLVRVKQDGKWKIHRDIWASNAPSKPE